MLSTVAIPAGTSWTLLRQIGGSLRTTAEVGFCNANKTQDVAVGLAVTTTSTAPTAGANSPASSACAVHEFARVLGPAGIKGNTPLTRSLVVHPGQYVWVQADKAGVSATIQGHQE